VLRGKTILAVDDEPDVLETIVEVLDMCRIETAGSFDKAQQLLETRDYDIAILDIMGVKGLHLLDLAVKHRVPAVMLTAPALTPEYILRSMDRGAISYISKEELACLDSLLSELLELMGAGRSPWRHTLERLEPLLDERLPPGWQQSYGKLWDQS
jgi:CheY-like chemotaxis protein